jgi:uncharacterized protein YggE
MRYRTIVPAAGLLAGAVLGLMSLVGAGGSAQRAFAQTAPAQPTVTVGGQGIVSAPPDVIILQIGVSVQAGTVADARAQAAQAATAVIAALQADGVAQDDIKTVQFSIGPRYDTQNGRQVLRGYQVDNVLQVKVRSLDTAGKVIDDAVAAGGDAVVVQNISFSIENTDAIAHQARMQAMDDAKTKAADYAASVGMTVGKVVSIHEETAVPPQPVQFAAPAPSTATAARTPIEAGSLQVRVQVTVVFALQ